MNNYQNSAHLYDSTITNPIFDFNYYTKGLKRKSRILDFGCGTGRVAIEIAKNYKKTLIDCVDISGPMLDQFRKKIEDTTKLKDRISIFNTDMRNFEFNEQYDVIIFPLQSFHCLQSKDDQIALLKKCRDNLQDKGRIIISIFDFEKLIPNADNDRVSSSNRLNNKLYTIEFMEDISINKLDRTLSYKSKYLVATIKTGEIIDTIYDYFDVALITNKEIETIADLSGLSVKKVYNDFLPYEWMTNYDSFYELVAK